jgi:hypothetical protein
MPVFDPPRPFSAGAIRDAGYDVDTATLMADARGVKPDLVAVSNANHNDHGQEGFG